MKQIKNDLVSTNYTKVLAEEEYENFAPNYFRVQTTEEYGERCLATIKFQNGAMKESDLNGVFNEDLIAIVIHRLECFQESKFNCKENQEAIICLENALKSLKARTEKRKNNGTIGTMVVDIEKQIKL